jgi:signal transduction histidine kinase
MEKDKDIFPGIPNKAIETIFWLMAISIAIFLNLSPQIFKKTNPIFIIILITPFLIIILSRIWRLVQSEAKRIISLLIFSLIVLIPLLLITTKAAELVMFYYLPAVIAISMALLVVMDPRIYVIILVGLCVFFLGEAFFGISITVEGELKYPIMFLRIFSLTFLTIFIYYLYTKETSMRKKLDALIDKLKTLDRVKSDFVANVSHELRTPLTSIKNAAILLEKKISGHEKEISVSDEELLNIIISNVDRQSRLIGELLDLAKIEKGKLSMTRSSVDIGKVAEEALKSIAIQATTKNIKIIADIQQNLPKIYASEDRIAEVYTNLLDNAIKYNKENGKVILQIRSIGDKIESIVEDTGIGISPENLGKLFDRFRQLEDALKHKNKGVGLGLVITKEIIELHGGRIWVESKLGVGSKFIFTLPRGLREEDQRLFKNEG